MSREQRSDLAPGAGTAREPAARIEVLGGFRVLLPAGGAAEWPKRRAAELVELLALADGHTLRRDVVIEALWPQLGAEAGGANLRKAAHHARHALGDPDAVVLQRGWVSLFPGRPVDVDLNEFIDRADAALRQGRPEECSAAFDAFPGELLPDSLYADWTRSTRTRLEALRRRLLAAAERWEKLVELDPTDEEAYRALIDRELAAGRRHAAIRWYGLLEGALSRELGIAPGAEAQSLHARCLEGVAFREPALIGRDVELAAAAEALAAAARGEAGALIVRGPAGIGKSTLIRTVAGAAREQGWIVVSHAGAADGVPYAPLTTAIEQLLGRDRALADAVGERSRSVLAELTALAGPAEPHEGPLTRHGVIEAARRLVTLTADATGAGVLLAVDDAHLIDDATVEVVRHLAAAGGTPFAVVLGLRPESGRSTLAEAEVALTRGGRAVVLELGPLADPEAAALAAASAPGPLDRATTDRVVALAEGNPFLAGELARAAAADAGSLSLGRSVLEAIRARLVDLEPGEVGQLSHLAVAGGELGFGDVIALTGLAEDDAATLLDAALGRGVLTVEGARYRFRHELVRRALEEPVPPHRREAIHREAATRLSQAGASPAAIAGHWLAAGRPGDAEPWLLAAARQAYELGAYRDSRTQLERLLEHEPGHVEALCMLAEVLDLLGDPTAADAYDLAAGAAGPPQSHELRPREAFVRLKSGDPEGALETLAGAKPVTPAGRINEALTISAAAAIGHLHDSDLAAEKAEQAYRLAIELGESWAQLEASWAYALAAHARGELPERLRQYLRDARGMPELATRLFDGQLCVTDRLLYGAVPYEEVIGFADSLGAEARRLGAMRGEAFALTLRGSARLLSGDVEGALRDLGEGERLHDTTGGYAGAAVALQSQAQAKLAEGNAEAARALALSALGRARESQVGFHTFDRIYGTLAAAGSELGDGVRMVEEAEAAVRGPTETCPTCRITFLVPAGIASVRGGDLERARRYEQDAAALIGFASLPPAWDAGLAELRGLIARAEGADGAERLFREAAETFSAAGQPRDAARCAELVAG